MNNHIEHVIITATNEALDGTNGKLMKDVVDTINQRSENPKIAVLLLAKRFMILKKPKIQLLTLELLEFCCFACGIRFLTQISSTDFLQRFNVLFQPSINQEVQKRAYEVLVAMAQLMSSNPDLFPTFLNFYNKLQARGVIMPNIYCSPYEELKEQSLPKPDILEECPKVLKLKKDLEIVKQNLILTNEIIDSSEPEENIFCNDILTDMIKTLRGVEQKLKGVITNLGPNDEIIMNYCLELNDDLLKTFERYHQLKYHQKPLPLKITLFSFEDQKLQEVKPIDWTKYTQLLTTSKYSTSMMSTLSDDLQQQMKTSEQQKKQPQVVDLLELFEIESDNFKQTNQSQEEQFNMNFYPQQQSQQQSLSATSTGQTPIKQSQSIDLMSLYMQSSQNLYKSDIQPQLNTQTIQIERISPYPNLPPIDNLTNNPFEELNHVFGVKKPNDLHQSKNGDLL